MTKHIAARTSDIPPGGNKVVGVEGRDIVIFHVNGEFFALLNRCPHEGAPLSKAAQSCRRALIWPKPFRSTSKTATSSSRRNTASPFPFHSSHPKESIHDA